MISAHVIRSYASGVRLALTVELPCCPSVAMRLMLPDADNRRIVTIMRVTVEARDWAPGLYAPAVEIETALEPATAEEPARRYGWKPLDIVRRQKALPEQRALPAPEPAA
jgi:hypothetical protein